MHQSHKRCRGVGQTEGHDSELVETIASLESCLVNIIGMKAALMVSTPEVQGCEVLSAVELVKEFRRERKGAAVLDGLRIETAVVNAEA